ncbi:TetR/AcrR family transcriptional regulator [Nitratireductor thuwali]|uniref:HTH-type transcriptional regulator YxaF n=1 Tax=Nitratireductor thuwali TaxID=2267699 RepID=A0ABY5MID6_9HYPH|nr:putative HTH-type transcriptional regulator YxaF [Nitratireductor thuwali]
MKPSYAPKTKRGQVRREQILRAAERVFGTIGYADTSITDITREANTAQGTLYIYFKGKHEVFIELVREMGHLTREVISRTVSGAPSRLEAERLGLSAFLRFVAERPELYRIVEEARIAAPDAYRAYFTEFANAYRSHLLAAEATGEIRPGNAEIRAWALMGMAKTLGERYVLWQDDTDLDQVVDSATDLIRNGLEP